MIYSVYPDRWPGSTFPPVPCDVFDANGARVASCLMCNTETGEVHCHELNSLGVPVLNEAKDSAVIVQSWRPAPLEIRSTAEDGPIFVHEAGS